mmetsp:Transcript_29992/g.28660  ORF Transcript_29992/g.28660 Transcript_29992/m.28660 type:complete len:117 (-) Transcript_29992:38-388(-)
MSKIDVYVETIKSGDGNNFPRQSDCVTVHYDAFLAGAKGGMGEGFDSSRERGKPLRFKVGAEEVIPGLDLGIVQMSIGERATLAIPANLAYGPKGFPGRVPPNTNLIFDIELINFN